MTITKAIIPVAGWGTRRLPITKTIEKSMLPICNRPLVDYSVQELSKAGVRDFYIVVASQATSQVQQFYQENPSLTTYLSARDKQSALAIANTAPATANFHFVSQDVNSSYGTAIPVALVAKQFNLNEPVLVFMGDDFVWNPEGESAASALIHARTDSNESAILGVQVDPSTVSRYGVLSVRDGQLTDIIEKPKADQAPSNLINVSKYIMTPNLLQHIVDYVEQNNFSATDQEYLITDPIHNYLKHGGIMRVASTGGEYLDGGSLSGWLHANQVVAHSLGIF